MSKTARFGDLVRASGRPQFVTLWTAPEQDTRVSSATKENRVLTVFEEPGQKPRGQLGLHPGPHSMFLIFPRRLALDPEARVVGINYGLAAQPEVKDPILVPTPERKTKQGRAIKPKALPEVEPEPPPPPPKPAKEAFMVRIRRTATLEETRKVEAADQAEAERQAIKKAMVARFKVSKAEVRAEIIR